MRMPRIAGWTLGLLALLTLLLLVAAPSRAQPTPSGDVPGVTQADPGSDEFADEPAVSEDGWSQTVALLGEPFVQDALKAALLVGLLCAYLGVFVVLKRIVFVGAALANVASLGAALAFVPPVAAAFAWLVLKVPALAPLEHGLTLLLALTLMLLGVAFFSQHRLSRRIPREAIIGTAYASAAGLTVLILSKVQGQGQHELAVLQGNILGVSSLELTEVTVAAVIIGITQLLFYKEFVLVSFDPEVARTLGFNASGWELLWYLSLGVMIAVSIHVAGTILVFSYLVLPAVTALLLSRRLGVVLVLSVFFAALATVVGVLISIAPQFDLPTTPAIVAVSAALFALTWSARTAFGMLVHSRSRP